MTTDTRPPGRPRDEAIDAEIKASVFALIEEMGLGAVTIDAIADRAGVSKATIYRRWDSKEDLVIDAITELVNPIDVPTGDTIRATLIGSLTRMLTAMSHTHAGVVFPCMVGEIARRSDLGLRYTEAVVRPGRRAIADQIRLAIDTGELRADLDVETAVDMIMGPVLVQKLIGSPGDDRTALLERYVDYLLDGWATPAG